MDYTQRTLHEQQSKDQQKRELAANAGVSVIVVPFWWDRTADRYNCCHTPAPRPFFSLLRVSFLTFLMMIHPYPRHSLIASIKKARPDLLRDYVVVATEGIPDEMPPEFREPHVQIPDVGVPPLASFFTSTSVDPTNW